MRWGGRWSQLLQPLQRQGEVGPALGAGHGVDLVDDHVLDGGEGGPRLGGQEEVERLGGGDQDIGRMLDQPPSILLGVSPVLVATMTSGRSRSRRRASWLMPASGARRLRSTS